MASARRRTRRRSRARSPPCSPTTTAPTLRRSPVSLGCPPTLAQHGVVRPVRVRVHQRATTTTWATAANELEHDLRRDPHRGDRPVRSDRIDQPGRVDRHRRGTGIDRPRRHGRTARPGTIVLNAHGREAARAGASEADAEAEEGEMTTDSNARSPPASVVATLLKIGGLTVSLAAIVAACGDDRGGEHRPRPDRRRSRRSPNRRNTRSTTRCCSAPARRSSSRRSWCTRRSSNSACSTKRAPRSSAADHREPPELDRVMDELTVAAGGEVVAVQEPVDGRAFPRADHRCDQGQRQSGARHLQRGGQPREPRCGDVPAVLDRGDRARAAHWPSSRRPHRIRATRRRSSSPSKVRTATSARRSTASRSAPTPMACRCSTPIPFRFGSVAQFELIVGAPNEEGTREDFVDPDPVAELATSTTSSSPTADRPADGRASVQ